MKNIKTLMTKPKTQSVIARTLRNRSGRSNLLFRILTRRDCFSRQVGIAMTVGVFLLFFQSHSTFAAENPTCQQEYVAAFDRIDEIFEASKQENLESEKAMQITGVDAVEFFSSSIGAYNCQMKMACYLVQKSGSDFTGGWENNRFPFSECGGKITSYDESGARTEVPATWKNALEVFNIQNSFNSCRIAETLSPAQNFEFWRQCEDIRRTKVTMEMEKLSANLKQSASEKRTGFFLAKLNELHQKLSPEKGGGLVNLAQEFVTKFKSVLSQIQCTVPETETVSSKE